MLAETRRKQATLVGMLMVGMLMLLRHMLGGIRGMPRVATMPAKEKRA